MCIRDRIRVNAGLVGVGNYSDILGSDGDMLGFALAIRGVNGVVSETDSSLDSDPGPDSSPPPEPELELEDETESGLSGKPIYEKEGWNDEIPNKINDNSKTPFLFTDGFYWIGGSCLVLIVVCVVVVAAVSNNIDKKRKRKENDEQISISQKN